MEKHITIQDVAKVCKVSAMTVSRAFRQKSVIHPLTRKRIIECAAELGYIHATRQGRPQTPWARENNRRIQLIFGSTASNISYFHMRLLTAVEQKLAERGYECIIRSSPGEFDVFMRLLESAKQDQSMATIILGSFPEKQLASLLLALPGALLLDNSGDRLNESSSSFSFDNEQAAMIGVMHLAANHRRRILLINGYKNHFFTEELLSGYKIGLKKSRLPFHPELVLHTDFSAKSAAEALREFFNRNIAVDAIFTNDEMATGVYRVLQERNIKIPDEIAVCGCDNLPIGEQLYPELTSIKLNYDDLAACAIKHILSDERTLRVCTKLAPELIVKQSSGG